MTRSESAMSRPAGSVAFSVKLKSNSEAYDVIYIQEPVLLLCVLPKIRAILFMRVDFSTLYMFGSEQEDVLSMNAHD